MNVFWRRTIACSFGAVLALAPILLAAQQRDAPATAVGTAEIAGVVVNSDNPAQPLRRAVVTLTGGGLNPRSVLSDDAGRFTFGRLPAGTYNVTSRKAAYLAAPYGARRPGRAGMPVVLKDGQKSAISISMFRGSVISGVLRDTAGFPVAGLDVRAIDVRLIAAGNADSPPYNIAKTDDRGVYRIYDLLPGDYVVIALPMPTTAGAIVAPATAANDAALAALAAQRPASPGYPTASPSPSPTPSPQPIGFAPIFFPGTPRYDAAATVHVDAEQERAGIDFELRALPTAAIEGAVRGNIPDITKASITLFPSGPQVSSGMTSNSLSGYGINAEGRFRYANLPPGRYRLVARAQVGTAAASAPAPPTNMAAGGGGRGNPAGAPPTDYLYGFVDVDLNGQDVTGLQLVLQPGGTISGKILFAGSATTPRPTDMSSIRPSLSLQGGSGMVSSGGLTMGSSLITSSTWSNADGTFEIRGIGPGRFTFNASAVGSGTTSPWKVRTVMAGDRDLLDDATELGPGIDLRNVVVTFTDARTEISGTLQGASGELVTEYYIVAFPADRALWRPRSRRILHVRPGTDGRFIFSDPPAGEYLLVAMTDLDPIDLLSVSFFEPLASAGVKLAVAEGEKKIQDLKIR